MLTAQQVKAAKPTDRRYKLFDRGGVPGLYLEVMPTGSKSWRLKRGDKRPTLGRYPDMTLGQAREAAQTYRSLEGQPRAVTVTFGDVYEHWWSVNTRRWRSSYQKTLSNRLDHDVLPALRGMPIGDVTPPVILALLRQIEARGSHATAAKVKTAIGQIMRYAVASGHVKRDPTQDLRGALQGHQVRPMAAITTLAEARKLWQAIEGTKQLRPQVRALLLFSALTFQRPSECRLAAWGEIDGDTWRIPAERMKMHRDHIVPLSAQALGVLETMQGHDALIVFPGVKRPHLSADTARMALRRLGYGKDTMTAHGFRSMASSILHEHGWEPDVIEAQLAHQSGSIRMVYNRARYLDQRRQMMQAWADLLAQKKAGP